MKNKENVFILSTIAILLFVIAILLFRNGSNTNLNKRNEDISKSEITIQGNDTEQKPDKNTGQKNKDNELVKKDKGDKTKENTLQKDTENDENNKKDDKEQPEQYECYTDNDCESGFYCAIIQGDDGGSCKKSVHIPKSVADLIKNKDDNEGTKPVSKTDKIQKDTGDSKQKPFVSKILKKEGEECNPYKANECLPNLYCRVDEGRISKFENGACRYLDKGTCTVKTPICFDVNQDKVCGCDIKVYDSACSAKKAGVNYIPLEGSICQN